MTSERPDPAWYEGHAFRLFAILLMVYLLGAFLSEFPVVAYLIDLGTAVAVVLSVRRMTASGTVFSLSTAARAMLLAANWLLPVLLGVEDTWARPLGSLFVLLLVLVALLGSVFSEGRVTVDRIFAAACAYLLMALCWSNAYQLVFLANPEAFTLGAADAADYRASLTHFSFTTLTTVGYGAISPVSNVARTLADLEALTGQLYVAVVIARLVSLQITHAGRD